MPIHSHISKYDDGWQLVAGDADKNWLDVRSNSSEVITILSKSLGANDGKLALYLKNTPKYTPAVVRIPVKRIGDDERDSTLTALSIHFQEGRLRRNELEERSSAALDATTQPQLDKLLEDMPIITWPEPQPEDSAQLSRHPTSKELRKLQLALIGVVFIVILITIGIAFAVA